MEYILEKLKTIEEEKYGKRVWEKWSLEEKKELLEIYHLISQKESYIFDLIHHYHRCDNWEDIFRDYNRHELQEKTVGVEVALEAIQEEQGKREEQKNKNSQKKEEKETRIMSNYDP